MHIYIYIPLYWLSRQLFPYGTFVPLGNIFNIGTLIVRTQRYARHFQDDKIFLANIYFSLAYGNCFLLICAPLFSWLLVYERTLLHTS